jgi:hypothetical protein
MNKNYHNLHLGYWTVGNDVYIDKTSALLASTQSKQHVHWHFNDDVFSKANWQSEPKESLEKLYAQRARQLREKYDYLVLSFSGGSDSTNILRTFIQNQITLDELVVQWPHEAAKNLYTPNNQDLSQDNWLSEWDYTVKPMLDWIAVHHPKIRITLYDYSQNVIDYSKNLKDTWYLGRNTYSPYGTIRHGIIENLGLGKLEKIQSIGYIYGVEKPKIMFKDGKYYTYFLDVLTGNRYLPDYQQQNSCVLEFFYWSPDATDIIAKQCHTIKRFLQTHTQFQWMVTGHVKHSSTITQFQDLIEPLIYPEHQKSFQANKCRPGLAVDSVLIKNLFDHRVIDTYNTGVRELMTHVDTKYYDPDTLLVVGFTSPLYEI